VVFSIAGGATATLRCELSMGQVFVQTRAGAAAKSLRVEAPCRFAVMPDFFADDIVIDAAELPVSSAELPADNILMHLLPDGRAIVMAVAKNADEDVRIEILRNLAIGHTSLQTPDWNLAAAKLEEAVFVRIGVFNTEGLDIFSHTSHTGILSHQVMGGMVVMVVLMFFSKAALASLRSSSPSATRLPRAGTTSS